MKCLFSILCTVVLFTSCKKDEPYAEVGTAEVSIVFTSPSAGETIHGSVELSIEGRIDANAMMSGYRVTTSNAETDEIMNSIDDIYEQTQYIVHHHWSPSVTQAVPVKIMIEALDQSGLILGSKSIEITCAP